MPGDHPSTSDSAGCNVEARSCSGDAGRGRYSVDNIAGSPSGQAQQDCPVTFTESLFKTQSALTAEQMNTIMEKLTVEEFKEKFFDEIVERIKSELAETSRDSESDTVCDVKSSSSQSSEDISPRTRPSKPYQATVEDDTELPGTSSSEGGEATPDSAYAASPISPLISSPLQTPTSSVRSDSMSSATSISSACQQDVTPMNPIKPSLRSGSLGQAKPKPNVRWSDRRPTIELNRYGEGPSGAPTTRLYFPPIPGPEPVPSAVDLKWGQLFDENAEPTNRLKQVLRGVADYLIAEFNQADSLVITPDKLALFYTKYMLESEVLAYHRIFNCTTKQAYKDLETLYQEMRCEYHLVQDHNKAQPCIPSLTTNGFRDWMTLLIRAYPDREAKRMASVVEDLPIEAEGSTLDGRRERLPKQFPRHLFPVQRHEKIHKFVSGIFDGWKRPIRHPEYPEPTSPFWQMYFGHPGVSVAPSDLALCSDYIPIETADDSNSNDPNAQRSRLIRAASYTDGAHHHSSVDSRGRYAGDMSPPPIGIHRRRSPRGPSSHRDSHEKTSGTGSSSRSSREYLTPDNYGTPRYGSRKDATIVVSGKRRTREDEYRQMQGRESPNRC